MMAAAGRCNPPALHTPGGGGGGGAAAAIAAAAVTGASRRACSALSAGQLRATALSSAVDSGARGGSTSDVKLLGRQDRPASSSCCCPSSIVDPKGPAHLQRSRSSSSNASITAAVVAVVVQ